MLISGRKLLLVLSVIVAAAGVAMLLWAGEGVRLLAGVIAACGVLGVAAVLLIRPSVPTAENDPDEIGELSDTRLRELARGTSMFLRDMEYRYSVRIDFHATPDRRRFMADVNTVRLGFVPAHVSENASEREGPGYVAFVYDGKRWRGPGLPCPDGQAEAVRHAARCVSPLAREEETTYDGPM